MTDESPGTGVLCPKCNGPVHNVTNTARVDEFIRRQRKCADCGHHFSTLEGTNQRGFLEANHLLKTLRAMTPDRRRLIENLIEELK